MLSGGKGAGFSADSADIKNPTTVKQANTAYDQAQSGLTQQQNFMNALQAQNGLANQSNVYGQLQGVADGTGPNPAMAQLNQATGANVASQAALMAGQRGANSNVGLMARQAAQQGGNLQQQAIGQGASMQANQSLNALGQMGATANQQVLNQAQGTAGYNQAVQNEQSQILGGIANQNNAAVGMQSNVNSANAAIAGVNAGTQGKILGGIVGGPAEAMAHGGMVKGYADGGTIDTMGPSLSAPAQFQMTPSQSPPQSFVGNWLNNQPSVTPIQNTSNVSIPAQSADAPRKNDSGMYKQVKNMFSSSSSDPLQGVAPLEGAGDATEMAGGAADAIVPAAAAADTGTALAGGAATTGALAGGAAATAGTTVAELAPLMMAAASTGGKIKGKAPVRGDSPKNDTVPAMLSPGEIVIPRSIAEHADAPALAAAFVRDTLAKQKAHSGKFADGGMQADAPAMSNDVPVMPDSAAAPQSGAPAFNADSPQSQAPRVPMAVVPAPAAAPVPQGSSDPLGMNVFGNTLQKGMSEQKGGAMGAANAIGEEGAAGDQALQAAQDKQAQLLKNYQDHYAALDTKRQQFAADYANQKVDPQRFMSNMGTGRKIMTTIGLMLGGLGGALTGQGNQALAFLNKQIDADIDAQKGELGKRQNLLAANMQDFGNLKDATDMTKVMMNEGVSTQLKQLAARYQGKIEGARALQAAGTVDTQNAAALGQIAQRKALTQGVGAGQALPASLDPGADRRIELQSPKGTQVLHAPDAATANKIRPQLEALDELSSVSSRISDFNKNNGTVYNPLSEKSGRADGLNREMEAAIAHAEASGGQIGRLVDKFGDMAPKAGAFAESKQAGKMKEMADFVAAQKAALIRNNLQTGPAFGK